MEKMSKLIENNALTRDRAMAFDKNIKLEKVKQQKLAELVKQQKLEQGW